MFCKKITFDYPKDFVDNLIPREGSQQLHTISDSSGLLTENLPVKDLYPYYTEVKDIFS